MLNEFGAYETNGLRDGIAYHSEKREDVFFEDFKKTDKVVLERLRMVTDSGFPFYDISYIHVTVNGKRGNIVDFPTMQLGKRTWKSELINICQKQGVYIKDIVNNGKVSILR